MIFGDTDVVLDIQDVADQVGVKASSIKYYWKHGRMPVEDVTFNGTPGWYRQTINDWRPAKAILPFIEEEEDRLIDTLNAAIQEGLYDPMGAVTFPKVETHEVTGDALADAFVESVARDFGGYEPELGYVIDYGDDESLGMADALADIESEFGTLVNEEI